MAEASASWTLTINKTCMAASIFKNEIDSLTQYVDEAALTRSFVEFFVDDECGDTTCTYIMASEKEGVPLETELPVFVTWQAATTTFTVVTSENSYIGNYTVSITCTIDDDPTFI